MDQSVGLELKELKLFCHTQTYLNGYLHGTCVRYAVCFVFERLPNRWIQRFQHRIRHMQPAAFGATASHSATTFHSATTSHSTRATQVTSHSTRATQVTSHPTRATRVTSHPTRATRVTSGAATTLSDVKKVAPIRSVSTTD